MRVAVAVLLVTTLLVGTGWSLQRRLVYLPSAAAVGPPPPGVEEVALRTEDGLVLRAWWLPASGPDRGAAVLILPGNAGDRTLRLALGRALTAAGLAVLLVDYRGYGGNPGRPSEEGLAADARAGHRYLTEERGGPPPVVFGESLGAAVAVRLATERPASGVVLRSPFVSLADVAAEHYPVPAGLARLLLHDRFPVAEQVATVTAPVSVVYGSRDGIVPPAQSRAVAAAAGATVTEIDGADHNDAVLTSGPAVVAAVVAAGVR